LPTLANRFQNLCWGFGNDTYRCTLTSLFGNASGNTKRANLTSRFTSSQLFTYFYDSLFTQ
jgi:hypothetical protein